MEVPHRSLEVAIVKDAVETEQTLSTAPPPTRAEAPAEATARLSFHLLPGGVELLLGFQVGTDVRVLRLHEAQLSLTTCLCRRLGLRHALLLVPHVLPLTDKHQILSRHVDATDRKVNVLVRLLKRLLHFVSLRTQLRLPFVVLDDGLVQPSLGSIEEEPGELGQPNMVPHDAPHGLGSDRTELLQGDLILVQREALQDEIDLGLRKG
mmetsp:Transcript_24368/g.79615  ORF Transcript_24368/g.79615 Transcript_24368/m.79615 type:complete len:208 (-) Transcript_24368:650-1273(-)